jgi:hypothetical protein
VRVVGALGADFSLTSLQQRLVKQDGAFPSVPQLAVSFGFLSRDRRLIFRGSRAGAVSTALAFAAGALVALVQGGPIHFTAFKGPVASFAISALIGVTAGLSNADDPS